MSDACVKLAAQSAHYTANIAELKAQKVEVPPYLAGYAAAAYDAEVALGCPVATPIPATTSKKTGPTPKAAPLEAGGGPPPKKPTTSTHKTTPTTKPKTTNTKKTKPQKTTIRSGPKFSPGRQDHGFGGDIGGRKLL
ncbi:MAG: hypothetical protein Q9175_005230 [Cornicularia normoerica]